MQLDTPVRVPSRPALLGPGPSGTTRPGPLAATGTAVLFTGADAPPAPLVRALYGTFPAYRAAFDALRRTLDARLPIPLAAVVFAPEQGADARLLGENPYARCALFGHQVALFRLWESWGLDIAAVAGRGTGSVAAAHVAGGLAAGAAARLLVAGPARHRTPGNPAHPVEGYGTVLACGPVPGNGAAVGDVRALARALAALQLHGPPLDWERLARGAGARTPAAAP
ncbi:acyltransferase domain-containing protein [Streptomyces genisteinicus]|uniref:Acyltransferase domain-containing protein n=1 Tax=Streptomyces genisteinicus TaxID=2768068 RepID=A0A7H0I521_9ACTN|nr:acyltransferase domain-containing protein [Streptomyces genisteinicus]QNP67887.1 acyltransferase domain-containing protein [Streptomyces genisteinicus]